MNWDKALDWIGADLESVAIAALAIEWLPRVFEMARNVYVVPVHQRMRTPRNTTCLYDPFTKSLII